VPEEPVVLALEAPEMLVAVVVAAVPSAAVDSSDTPAACVSACSKLENKLFALPVLLVPLVPLVSLDSSVEDTRWPPWWCDPLPTGATVATSAAKVAL